MIDETITFVLNLARKYTEGFKRTIQASNQKVRVRSTMLYYKGLMRKAEGKRIDESIIKGRRKFLGID